jgi:ABC-2 type transport system ATP-binding protein
MLQAIELTKYYEDGHLALDALTLDIKQGEIFFLLGANGAGKTTTINLFLNFIEPTSGQLLIDGIDVTKDPLETKRHISYVSENVMLYGNFTARQNLDFFAHLAGKQNLSKQHYYDAMRNVGLQDEAFERKLKTFSKGMRQKVGLAIAMVKNAQNILLDEPTSGLDPRSAAELMQADTSAYSGKINPDVYARHFPSQIHRRPRGDYERRSISDASYSRTVPERRPRTNLSRLHAAGHNVYRACRIIVISNYLFNYLISEFNKLFCK